MLFFKIKCHFLNTDLVLYSLLLGLIYENAFKVVALMLYDIPHQLINLRCPRALIEELRVVCQWFQTITRVWPEVSLVSTLLLSWIPPPPNKSSERDENYIHFFFYYIFIMKRNFKQ